MDPKKGGAMTRQEAITRAAADVAAAADYSQVGKIDIFSQQITADDITHAVLSAIDRLNTIIVMTDTEWDRACAASEAEENRVEDEAWKHAAGQE